MGLGHIRIPGVLADRAADADRPQRIRPAHGPGVKDPLFVEHRLVGQMMLELGGDDLAALADQIGVEELGALDPGRAHGDGRPIGAIPRQRPHGLDGGGVKGRLHHQILRIVAGDEHLGEGHQIGARGFARRPGIARQRGIAGDIAHGRVELCQRDAECVGHVLPLRCHAFPYQIDRQGKDLPPPDPGKTARSALPPARTRKLRAPPPLPGRPALPGAAPPWWRPAGTPATTS